ncbi:MAG: LLM class flavin-dependent oxidoreductase [Caldilineaceae bacterium]
MTLAISVLDLAPVRVNGSATESLYNSIALAKAADQLGYTRYWLAEHHNIPSIAIAAPEIMIALVAHETRQIRVGSGGVMLPNHAPLRVAEIFRTLAALYPGRIDLGIGRAPGTDPLTAYALRQSRERLQIHDFPDQLADLMAFGRSDLAGSDFPADNPFRAIRTIPIGVQLPPIWLLGSSRAYSASVAADHGLGFAFAYHINPTLEDAKCAIESYRTHFTPTAERPESHALLALNVLCCETAERAEELATILDLAFVRRQRGELVPLPTLEEALAYSFSLVETAQAQKYRERLISGDPAMVRAQIDQLVAETGADEVIITTTIADLTERMRSYELVADAMGIGARITMN